jgi:hypothetical protein
MRWYQPHSFDEVIWIGEHAPGWSHIISLSGLCIVPGPLSQHSRRMSRHLYIHKTVPISQASMSQLQVRRSRG